MTLYFQLKDQDRFNMKVTNKFQRKVLKRHPSASLTYTETGVRVMVGDTYLAEEFYLPETHDAEKAWEYAALACRTKQQFNRTHPMRMDLSDIESKINRINKRRGARHKRK